MLKSHHAARGLFLAVLAVAALVATLSDASAQRRVVVAAGDGRAVDRDMKAAIIDSLSLALGDVYVFADVAEHMERRMRERFQGGDYDLHENLAPFLGAINADLQDISHDLHLRVRELDPDELEEIEAMKDAPPDDARDHALADEARSNFGFREVKMLPGNVGYVRLDGFVDASLGGPTAIAAMNFVAHADAVIFDVRHNGGGSPSMIQLLTSYFVDEPTHLNSFYIRKTDETKQFWTASHVDGPRMADTDVYILTSGYTFSAAEEFSYNFKSMKRATLVGETTGGGAHPVEFHYFADLGVGMTVPFGRAVNPITGTNWEGTGVSPHIEVAADKALDTAHLAALEAIEERTEDPARKTALAWDRKAIAAKLDPPVLDAATMASYAGQYEDRRVWLEDGNLYYARGDRQPMQMNPITDTLFGFEALDWFRLEVVLEHGRATKLVGHYVQGMTDESARTATD